MPIVYSDGLVAVNGPSSINKLSRRVERIREKFVEDGNGWCLQ